MDASAIMRARIGLTNFFTHDLCVCVCVCASTRARALQKNDLFWIFILVGTYLTKVSCGCNRDRGLGRLWVLDVLMGMKGAVRCIIHAFQAWECWAHPVNHPG